MVGLSGVVGQDVQNGVDQPPRMGIVRQAVIDTGAVGKPLDQPGIGHQLQVTGDAGLALVQNARHLHDRQLFTGQQRQDAQAGGFAGGAKRFDSLIGVQAHMII